MKKKLLMALAVILTCSMALTACGGGSSSGSGNEGGDEGEADGSAFAEKPEVTLILTNHDPDGSLPGQYVKAWADMVYDKSLGRIKVEVSNGGALAKPAESLDKVREGSVDLAWGLQSFYPGQFPITDGLSLPYLPYTSASQASEVIMNIWENTDLLASEYADVQVILLRANCDAPLTTAKKKLETAASLKGMTVRATAKPIVSWLEKFGANGQGCPINELYQNLSGGTFDGAITDWHGIDSFSLFETAKYFADEKVQYNTYYFLMNKAKYDGLSDDLKAVIDECSGQAALELMNGAWDDMTASAKVKVAENGGEVYTLPEAEHQKLVDAATAISQQWIKDNGESGQALYDKIVELSAQ